MPLARTGHVSLTFRGHEDFKHVDDPLGQDISALARVGPALFLSCDETAGVERLLPSGKGRWGKHRHFNLGAFFDLPGGPAGEMDIEGLAHDDGWLWIVGSHSLKRGRPKRGATDPADALARMVAIKRDPNRYFLGRLPLLDDADGAPAPVKRDGDRHAQSIKLAADKSALLDWLAGDPHLDSFLNIPSKENGFDIEGIAASGDRVWLGLRGPVLRGHGLILELSLRPRKQNQRLLKAQRIEADRRYRKYLLPTRGLGLRDLMVEGDDLLMLLGPTMALAGRAYIVRWRGGALRHCMSGVVDSSALEQLVELPAIVGADKAEGLDRLSSGELLVVYDDPAQMRLSKNGLTLKADLFS